jgi:integrase
MSVRKRRWTTKSGEVKEVWVTDYVSQNGTRHLKTFERKKDADAFHAQVNVDVAAGVHTPHSKSITVEEAAEQWLTYLKVENRERSTVDAYTSLLKHHILPRIARIKLSSLSTPFIERFRDELLTSGISRASGRKTLGTLKSLIRDAQRRGNVSQNVATGVAIRANARDRKRLQIGVDVPTTDEVKRIIEASHGRARALLITACFVGLRSSELRGLRWQDVELKGDHGTIHVRQRADRYREIGRLKSASGERSIPCGPFVANALKGLRALERVGELVFANAAGKTEFHQSMSKRMLGAAQLKAGITKQNANGKTVPKYGMHALRHFFASWCINRRVDGGLELPLKTVQSRLGHATLSMTADVYGHLFPSETAHDELAEAEARLGLFVA